MIFHVHFRKKLIPGKRPRPIQEEPLNILFHIILYEFVSDGQIHNNNKKGA